MDKSGGVWRMVSAMGLSGTIGAFAVFSGQSPLTVVLFRCLIGAVALLGWLWYTGGWTKLDRSAGAWIAAGAAAIIGNWLCLFSAFSLCGISIATVIYHVQPFMLVLLAALAQRQAPDWRQAPFLLLAFVGVALTSGINVNAHQPALLQGVLLALAAGFLYALATLATRKLKAYPPAQIAGLQLVIGVIVLAPMATFEVGKFSAQAWGSLLVVGLVHTGLVYNLMYGAFQRLRAETIASLSFIYPAVALATDLLLFNAKLGPLQWLGMALILTSMLGNQRIGQTVRGSTADGQSVRPQA
ncbi:DMT family transporter [Massilia sp. TSP1-1-2]|uniref:DMT family transporter n=1 Tax=Massilia sp. TSP1-1-2 TaxID=2804649 RepID=UPI003CEE069C